MSKLGAHEQGRGVLTATGTVTILAATTGKRHHITSFCITSHGGAGSEGAIYEVRTTGTVAATCLTWHASNVGVDSHYFGEHGFVVSETGTRVVGEVSGANSTVNIVLTGYLR